MKTTGSADKLSEFMSRCLNDNLNSLIESNPKLKTNPKLAAVFKSGYWQGCSAYLEFTQLLIEEGLNNGVVSEKDNQSN